MPFPAETVRTALMNGWQLAQWWGPAGYRNEFREFNPVPGGDWRFDMIAPDGTRHANHHVFVSVSNDKIIFDHVSQPPFRMTIGIEARGLSTLFSFQMSFASAEQLEGLKALIIPSNEQNFDRLEALLRRDGTTL